MAPRNGAWAVTEPLRALLDASHRLLPDDLAATVAAHARMLGARETVLYLADYEQATPAAAARRWGAGAAGAADRGHAGRAGVPPGRGDRQRAADGRHRLWVPLLDGVERLGVAELVLAGEPPAERAAGAARALRHAWSPS